MPRAKEQFVRSIEAAEIVAVRLVGGQQIQIPRTSLPIFWAIYTGYKDEIKERNETLGLIGDASPLLIAVNEYCDIGVSAELRSRGVERKKREKLLATQQILGAQVATIAQEFLEKHQDIKNIDDIVKTFILESQLLSREREKFEGDRIEEFIHLDSAIAESFCMRLAAPDLTERVMDGADGLGANKPCRSAEELKERYGFYYEDKNTDPEETGWIKASHAAVIAFKVGDDMEGGSVDSTLQIPSYLDLAEKISEETVEERGVILRETRRSYIRRATRHGVFSGMTDLMLVAQNLTSRIKAKRSKGSCDEKILDNPEKLREAIFSTTLRHQLEKTGELEDVFR